MCIYIYIYIYINIYIYTIYNIIYNYTYYYNLLVTHINGYNYGTPADDPRHDTPISVVPSSRLVELGRVVALIDAPNQGTVALVHLAPAQRITAELP